MTAMCIAPNAVHMLDRMTLVEGCEQMWKLICFICWLPLVLFIICLEWLGQLPSFFMGFNDPKLQSLMVLRHWWKDLWGIKPEKAEFDCVGGYLYSKTTYTDGSVLFFRS
jgi:hypothetical protein